MRQIENKAIIEGLLSEVEFKEIAYTKDDGTPVEAIGGIIKVRVNQEINNEEVTLEVPVHFFANKLTKKGTKNPSFESLNKLQSDFISIAAGGIENADAVRLTGTAITMNEYYDKNGKFISYPRVTGSFISKIGKVDLKPIAEFSVEMSVGKIIAEVDNEGVETGRVVVTGCVPKFDGSIDVIPFIVDNPKAINFINTYWNDGDTVKMHGRLNFTSVTVENSEEVAFGDPIVKHYTKNVSELIGTAGTNPLEGDFALDTTEIEVGLKERMARLEAQKEKSMSRTKSSSAPTQSGFGSNLGF